MKYIYGLHLDLIDYVYVTSDHSKIFTEYLIAYINYVYETMFERYVMTPFETANVLVNVYGFDFCKEIKQDDIIYFDLTDVMEKQADAGRMLLNINMFERENLRHELYKCMIRTLSDFL